MVWCCWFFLLVLVRIDIGECALLLLIPRAGARMDIKNRPHPLDLFFSFSIFIELNEFI